MKKIKIYLITIILLLSIYYPTYGETGIEITSEQYGVSEELVEKYLNDGFTIDKVNYALYQSNLTGEDIETLLEDMDSSPVNNSSSAESTVEGELPQVVQMDAATSSTDKKPFVFVKTKIDEAPFSIQKDTESISSLNGSLSIQETDLSLPGRNGLSFQLDRIYDSNASQYYDMGAGYEPGNSKYYVYVNTDQATKTKGFKAKVELEKVMQSKVCGDSWVTTTFLSNAGIHLSPISYNLDDTLTRVNQWKTPGAYYFSNPEWSGCISEHDVLKQYKIVIRSNGQSTLDDNDSYNFIGARSYNGQTEYGPFTSYSEAQTKRDTLNSSPGTLIDYDDWVENNGVFTSKNYYVSSNPNAYIDEEVVSEGYSYNRNSQPKTDSKFPIGKGWSWDIPYIQINDGKKHLNLGIQGSYEVDSSNKLIGYLWKDLTFSNDTSVIVNGRTSAFKVKSIQGISKFFDSEGNLIKITDNYNNGIYFTYEYIPIYQTVLTKIEDAIGNSISISYTSNEVILTKATSKGNQIVKYTKNKTKDGRNIDILRYVTDPMGRKTTFEYKLEPAKYNLFNSIPDEFNPYALLNVVTYPTGGSTVYSYETFPITRYTGNNSVNQAYRITSRHDIDHQKNGGVVYNKESYDYNGDDAYSNYGQSKFVTTTIDDGVKKIAIETEKVHTDSSTSPVFYKNKETTTYNQLTDVQSNTYHNMEKVVSYTYDRGRKLTVPDIITTTYKNTSQSTLPPRQLVLSRVYDEYGNILSETNPLGYNTQFYYDSTTHLLSNVTQPIKNGLSKYTEYTRTPEGSIKSIQVRENSVEGLLLSDTQYSEFDSYGNFHKKEEKDDARTVITQIDYSSDYRSGYPTSQSNTVSDVNGESSIIKQEALYEKSTGKVIEYTDGNSNITKYGYDLLDRLDLVTYPDNSTYQYEYKDLDNQIIATDEENKKSFISWNTIGLKINEGYFESVNEKISMKYGYDQNSRLIWQEDSLGYQTSFTNDPLDRVISTKNPIGAFTNVIFNDVQNTKEITDPEGYKTKEYNDNLNRFVQKDEIIGSDTNLLSSLSLDNVGNELSETDGEGYTTEFTYDALSRLTDVKMPNNEKTHYTYSLIGNLTHVTSPDGKIQEKVYDELGRLIKEIGANKYETTYELDGNSNITKKADRNGKEFNYVYSNRNLLTLDDGPEENIDFSYYKNGKRKSMTDSTGVTSYQYDLHTGDLSKVTYPDGLFIEHKYNSNGKRIQLTTPFGTNIYYQFTPNAKLEKVGYTKTNNVIVDPEVSYTYKKNGKEDTITLKNGIQTAFTYDGLDLSSVTHKDSSAIVLNSYGYQHDDNGNITSLTENNQSYGFTYDSLDRIFTSDMFNEKYQYDQRGNRLTLTSSQLPSPSDANIQYDERNRIIKVAKDGKEVSYKYNGDGLLYERTENGITTRYYFDGDNLIAEGTVQAGTTAVKKAEYLYGNKLVSKISNVGKKSYYTFNGHGDVKELRDDSGALLNQYSYDIWGNPISVTEQEKDNHFMYSGEFWDTTTSLQYLRARWYDPSLGRFISEDTYPGEYKDPLSLNLYTYVENNPLKYVDPSGHEPKFADNDGSSIHDSGRPIGGPISSSSGSGNANKVKLDLVGKLAQSLKNVIKKMDSSHGNSKSSSKQQHGYEIFEKLTGKVNKTGISGQTLNKNGTSPRANSQVNKWNELAGKDIYQARVVNTNLGNRQQALDWERVNSLKLYNAGNPMNRHARPRPWE
jgi:RHS repeat-associated protein